jgi:hypothetical protein
VVDVTADAGVKSAAGPGEEGVVVRGDDFVGEWRMWR